MTKLSGASLPTALQAELERCRNDEAATLSLGIAQTTAQAVELLHGGAASGSTSLHAEPVARDAGDPDRAQDGAPGVVVARAGHGSGCPSSWASRTTQAIKKIIGIEESAAQPRDARERPRVERARIFGSPHERNRLRRRTRAMSPPTIVTTEAGAAATAS